MFCFVFLLNFLLPLFCETLGWDRFWSLSFKSCVSVITHKHAKSRLFWAKSSAVYIQCPKTFFSFYFYNTLFEDLSLSVPKRSMKPQRNISMIWTGPCQIQLYNQLRPSRLLASRQKCAYLKSTWLFFFFKYILISYCIIFGFEVYG